MSLKYFPLLKIDGAYRRTWTNLVPGDNIDFDVAGDNVTINGTPSFDGDIGQYKMYLTVGSSNADYITDGVADDVQINQALAAVKLAGGGRVSLKAQQFNILNTINITGSYTELVGEGMATKLVFQTNANTTMISVTGTGVIHVHLKNFLMDGNKANNSTGTGLNLSTPWLDSANDTYHVFEDLCIKSFNDNGVNVPLNSDTRVTKWSRITVQKCDGNGFYMPVFCLSDSFFDNITVSEIRLNGFYLGCNTSYFDKCYTFYCGSAGGNYHGFYIAAYNLNFNECVAQDNYQSGFYGDNSQGYNADACTFTGCIADSNGQNGGTTYAAGFQGVDVYHWRLTGCASFTRIYPPAWTQKWGVRFSGGSSSNIVDANMLMYSNSTADYFDEASVGCNVYKREFNVKDYGALGNGIRVANPTSTSASANVTVSGATFTSADVGKTVVLYNDSAAGTIRTISTVTDATHIVLSGTTGITLSATGYISYGNDDSTAFANCIAAAAAVTQVISGASPNQPMGLGNPIVAIPAIGKQSYYFLTSQVTVTAGVSVQCDGMIFNALGNRYQPVFRFYEWTEILHFKMECCFGSGIQLGRVGGQEAAIKGGTIELWNVGKDTTGGFYMDGIEFLGFDFQLDRVWIKGGYRGMYMASGSDLNVNHYFAIGCNTAVELNATNQWHFSSLFMDTCGGTGNGGFLIDNGCSNGYASIQTYLASGVTKVVSPVVGIGQQTTTVQNYNIKLDIQANNSGGVILAVQRMTDLVADISANNSVYGGTGTITTGVAYGSNNGGYLRINANLGTGIIPFTGTRYNGYDYLIDGVLNPGTPSAALKVGQAKISGGAAQWGMPGVMFVSASTSTLVINEDRYVPFLVQYPITVTGQQFEVTAGPTGAANVRIGIYLADTDQQPTGAPLYDSGNIAVANGFTGLKTTTGLSTILKPGLYLLAINCDNAMTLRTCTAGSYTVLAAMGASPMAQRYTIGRTYAAFPTPGTKWTTLVTTGGGMSFNAILQWTDNI